MYSDSVEESIQMDGRIKRRNSHVNSCTSYAETCAGVKLFWLQPINIERRNDLEQLKKVVNAANT